MNNCHALAKADPINVHIGNLGCYQITFWLLICISNLSVAWVTLAHVFLAGPAPYICTDPEEEEEACSDNCDETDFDRSIFNETIVMTFNLICDNFWLVSFSQMMVMLGVVVGCIIFGILADQ